MSGILLFQCVAWRYDSRQAGMTTFYELIIDSLTLKSRASLAKAPRAQRSQSLKDFDFKPNLPFFAALREDDFVSCFEPEELPFFLQITDCFIFFSGFYLEHIGLNGARFQGDGVRIVRSANPPRSKIPYQVHHI